MDKFFDYAIPAVVGSFLLLALAGYAYASASGGPQLADSKVLEDKSYLSKHETKYADCHYTVVFGNFNIVDAAKQYDGQDISKEKLESLASEFKNKYAEECAPLISEYRDRYSMYVQHKKEAAKAELSRLDEWLGKSPEVISEPSPIFSVYQEYDPKSLQHPTNPNAKMLYSQQDYVLFVSQNL